MAKVLKKAKHWVSRLREIFGLTCGAVATFPDWIDDYSGDCRLFSCWCVDYPVGETFMSAVSRSGVSYLPR